MEKKKGGGVFLKKCLQARGKKKKTCTDRSYSLFPLLDAKKPFGVLLPAAVWAFEVAARL